MSPNLQCVCMHQLMHKHTCIHMNTPSYTHMVHLYNKCIQCIHTVRNICMHVNLVYADLLYTCVVHIIILSCVAPNDKMKEVLRRTVSEAKASISKVHTYFICGCIPYTYLEKFTFQN